MSVAAQFTTDSTARFAVAWTWLCLHGDRFWPHGLLFDEMTTFRNPLNKRTWLARTSVTHKHSRCLKPSFVCFPKWGERFYSSGLIRTQGTINGLHLRRTMVVPSAWHLLVVCNDYHVLNAFLLRHCCMGLENWHQRSGSHMENGKTCVYMYICIQIVLELIVTNILWDVGFAFKTKSPQVKALELLNMTHCYSESSCCFLTSGKVGRKEQRPAERVVRPTIGFLSMVRDGW